MVYENTLATKSRLEQIKEEAATDPGLKKVKKCAIEGWPNNKDSIPNEAKPYWSFREELSIINGIVFKGERLWLYLKLQGRKCQSNYIKLIYVQKRPNGEQEEQFFGHKLANQKYDKEVQHLSTKSEETAT